MPDVTTKPTHVLTAEAVRWSIDTLGLQKLHPTFVMYLYLRSQQRAGLLATASASSEELFALIKMPGNPAKPYYFPLIDRGKRSAGPLSTFWRAKNIPGSWSPSSISRQEPASWLGSDEGSYAWPDDHVDLALREMLYGERVSAAAMAAYFLRNDGFVLSGSHGFDDLVAGFRSKFAYPADADDEFHQLFDGSQPSVGFAWFEPAAPAEELANV